MPDWEGSQSPSESGILSVALKHGLGNPRPALCLQTSAGLLPDTSPTVSVGAAVARQRAEAPGRGRRAGDPVLSQAVKGGPAPRRWGMPGLPVPPGRDLRCPWTHGGGAPWRLSQERGLAGLQAPALRRSWA